MDTISLRTCIYLECLQVRAHERGFWTFLFTEFTIYRFNKQFDNDGWLIKVSSRSEVHKASVFQNFPNFFIGKKQFRKQHYL